MSRKNVIFSGVAAIALLLCSGATVSAADGAAIVRVTTLPAYSGPELKFSGTPAGDIRLDNNGTATIRADVETGSYESTLIRIDPILLNAGYSLTNISCDDPGSARRSSGDLQNRKANFEIDDDEAVTCTFELTVSLACKCPKEGRWSVVNNTGSMTCSGAVNMSTPLLASSASGTMEVNENCDTALAKGMSEDEADLEMRLQPDCSWLGTVGGERDGIPMVITFRWNLENEERIEGDLESNVSQPGMTCRMARTYRMDFES